MPKLYEENSLLDRGIQIAIELKKKKANIDKADRRQGVLQLLTASTLSKFPVVVILTDLNKYWQFFWLSKAGINVALLQPCSALTLIRDLLNERTCPLGERYTMKNYILEKHVKQVIRPPATGNQEPPVTENELLLELRTKVDPYELIPKSDVGNMEDFFCEMSESDVMQYKLRKTMEYLGSQPS